MGFSLFDHFCVEGMIIYKHQDKQFCNNPKAILYKSLGVWFGGFKKSDLVIDKTKTNS